VSTKLVVGVFTPSVLLAVARRTGRLAGDVQAVTVSSSPAQFRALLNGDIQVAMTSPDNVLAYRFSLVNPLGVTADVRIVSAVDRGMGLALYGRPGLAGAEALRGAVLGVDVPTSGFALAMYALGESLGLGREDYQLATLGSTPRRLRALLAGECDATMLGAGNELLAERAGCVALARVSEVCRPYLGSVLAIAGNNLGPATDLAEALRGTAEEIHAGRLDQAVLEAAEAELDLTGDLAARYLGRLRCPAEGLVTDRAVDLEALATIVRLRRRYLPEVVDGGDVLDTALEPASGLLARRTDA
jgi:ABC-type nitrate/sulfonate/bicarbonate transport system substrate-binding protein